MSKILDGKKVAEFTKQRVAAEVDQLKASGRRVPHLAAVLVGNDGASETYVGHKIRACESVGFQSSVIRLPADVSEAELLNAIYKLNNDNSVDGYIVQLPLPKHISSERITEAILPEKDVDGFHPVNLGKMVKGLPSFLPATPYGILKLLEYYEIETAGKHCVIVGRSDIVGKPMSILLARNANPGNCTVTLCHRYTQALEEIIQQADILIVAVGIPDIIKGKMVKENAVVIDVGITRVVDTTKKSGFRLKGDVNFGEVEPKCAYITPVPGGVGPMTVAALLENTLSAAKSSLTNSGSA